ncbi:MAG TPA: C1 family peptidase [bacterium]|jgi:bleomycin hydrolase
MFRFGVSLMFAGLLAVTAFCAEPATGLSQDQLQELIKSVQMDAATRAATNAVTNNDMRDLVMNRDVLMTNDDIFSFKLPTKGMTDQESSGRCWMFAGLNLMRQNVAKKFKLDEFELSQSYLAFWDKLEKANVFLEFIIDTRQRDLLDREVDKMLEEPVGDGGYWGYVINLVQKYGVVPKQFMSESHSSANTDRLSGLITKLMVRDASTLRKMSAQGKSVADLREEKMNMLKDVTRILVINYGVPPTKFEWRTTDDSTHVVSDPVTYTPQEFYKQVIGVDLSDYVCLGNYPDHPYGKNYSINLTRSMADKSDITFINIPNDQMKSLALKALTDSNRVWFGCDMGPDVSGKKGLMIKGLYNYEELLGVKLDLPKAERLDYRISSNNHAMVLVGVDVVNGKPRKWRVENSWGKDRGDGGFFTMSDEWFDEYVLNVVVPKRYLPADIVALTQQKPTPLPVWDPSWRSLQW